MVTITNGVNTFEVTSGSFESIFKGQGYNVVSSKRNRDAGAAPADGHSDAIDELAEKPIATWSKSEVKEYAMKHGIDLSGTTFNEAKELVKASMGIA